MKTASNAPKDTANILNSILNIPADVANTEKEIASPSTSPEERLRAINSMSLNSVLGNTILNYGKSLNKDLGEPLQGGNVLGRIINNFEDRPVSTTLDALPFLAAGKASLVGEGSKVADTAEANNINAAAQDVFKGSPNRAQQLLQPGKSKNIIGQIRDRVVANADSSGATISGDKIAGDFRTWADQAKLANIPDAATIEQAAVDAENLYKGKTFTPSELYKTYQKIENGYTTKGAPRTATSAYIDRGTQDILQNALEEKAPGFQKTTQMFSKVYNTEKGTAGKIIKNLPANAVKTGLNLTGLGFLRDILNP